MENENDVGADGLDAKQHDFLLALLQEQSTVAAAKHADISLRTAFRYKADPAFNAAYRRVRREETAAARKALQDAQRGALERLQEVFRQDDVPPATQIVAARAVLSLGVSQRDSNEFEDRCADLEEAIRGLEMRVSELWEREDGDDR